MKAIFKNDRPDEYPNGYLQEILENSQQDWPRGDDALLNVQSQAMLTYSQVLTERIAWLKQPA